ncbi:uncharacterized protein UBRO_06122 [Ustilago bromivora]|uniref:Phosphoglycerate mutase n=1 Tax=Ustilago bromivora TaxID=307758 RepID=A0A1K0G9Z2_9BASI|nr:uncharacterized protein UBRO_06122 [Ustilago bromivora]SYW84320.1 uncharacterized protein UBRO2_05420 [Ustilago bromivora]
MQHAILTLIRHTETTGNLNRLLQGVTDSPVTVFGQAQIDALARTWATTRRGNVEDKALKESTSILDLPPPTLIVCSPIGRARKTAEAIHLACTSAGSGIAGRIVDAFEHPECKRNSIAKEHHAQSDLALVVDLGLKEKDFGWKESTRGGLHIAGYPKGTGSGESRSDFLQRVHRVGAEWLDATSSLASSSATTKEKEGTAIPHIVIVSHGMWISTFLSVHPPTTITQVSGQPGFLPFAANTGMFSIKVQARRSAALESMLLTSPITELFRSNDIRHLANVKRQKGGIGRGAFDSKQTKLSSFFSQPRNTKEGNADGTIEGSPTKKRKT